MSDWEAFLLVNIFGLYVMQMCQFVMTPHPKRKGRKGVEYVVIRNRRMKGQH